MAERDRTTTPMIAVGYVAQTVGVDGATTLVLENGSAISISASAATALNEARQREGLLAIPTVTRSEARRLAGQLRPGGSGDRSNPPADEDPE